MSDRYKYRLFIDDERLAALKNGEMILIVRNFEEAVEIMESLGCPEFISFDHDLGEESKTGYDIAKWIVEKDMDEDQEFIPDEFEYYVHSQNPIGKSNIEGLLNSYIKQRSA